MSSDKTASAITGHDNPPAGQDPEWGVPLMSVKADLTTSALVVVDMQHGFVHRGSTTDRMLRDNRPSAEYYYSRLESSTIPNCERLIQAFRNVQRPVIYVLFGTFSSQGYDLSPRVRRRALEVQTEFGVASPPLVGTDEFAVAAELEPTSSDLVLIKHTLSAFNSTNIGWHLRQLGIESLFLTGVGTNGCVEGTARDGADLGFDCVLVEDATATFDQATQDVTVVDFARFIGGVTTTAAVLRSIA